jgi:hypothetical protein
MLLCPNLPPRLLRLFPHLRPPSPTQTNFVAPIPVSRSPGATFVSSWSSLLPSSSAGLSLSTAGSSGSLLQVDPSSSVFIRGSSPVQSSASSSDHQASSSPHPLIRNQTHFLRRPLLPHTRLSSTWHNLFHTISLSS